MSQSQSSINVNQYGVSPSAGPSTSSQAPIIVELDWLEKALMQLREGVGLLQNRLVGSVAKARPANGQSQKAANAVENERSAITNRLAHLSSVVADLQQTINILHEDLEL